MPGNWKRLFSALRLEDSIAFPLFRFVFTSDSLIQAYFQRDAAALLFQSGLYAIIMQGPRATYKT